MLPVAIALLMLAPGAVEIARRAVDLLLAEKYAELCAMFSPVMKKGLPEETLRTGVAPRLRAFGAVKKVLPPDTALAGDRVVVIFPVDFETAGINVQITINPAGEVDGMFFRPRTAPQGLDTLWLRPPYSRPETFRAEEVRVGQGEWELPGTLLLPRGAGPFPGVVLVHGSGPNDRDESLGPNKPLRDIAEGLASRGIAVLRYEKRTRQYPAKTSAARDLTLDQETVDDALAAAKLLRGRPEIDAARVYVLGHSLGGFAAPRIAQRDSRLAGVIILAGNTRPLEDLLIEQTDYLYSLKGELSANDRKQLEKLREMTARLRTLKPGDTGDLPLGVPASYWLDLQRYHPAAVARQLKTRMLILQGERDYQVTMADFAGWKQALAGRKDVTLRSYPALNHLFMAGEGKSRPEEYGKAGHVAGEVIEEIAGWIEQKSDGPLLRPTEPVRNSK